MALGSEDDPSRFNMAHMGLRLAQRANGVAKLHGEVSRNMFAPLYPGFEPDEVPIGSVTNGVHLPTWAAREMYDVAGDMADWQDLASASEWPAADKVSAERLWELRNTLRQRLVAMARATARKSHLLRGATVAELGWTESILDPDILTIGFARRVSTYKRLTLMLRDPARLRAILLDPDRPVQIVIAGKAHPADDGGKRYMQEMVRFTDDPTLRHRIVFLPDYDMGMAAVLCAGADVWLNNPIRPQEASGTSGMKAALNGGLNLSISDGWWDELYDGHDGWTIPTADGVGDDNRRDDLEAAALYDLIEKRVAPLFYRRGRVRPAGRLGGHRPAHPGLSRPAGAGHPDGARLRHRLLRPGVGVLPGGHRRPDRRQGAGGLEGPGAGGLAECPGDQCRHLRHRHRTVAGQRHDGAGATSTSAA